MATIISKQKITNLAIFAFGLQFVSSLQIANISSIYKFLGAPSHALPFLGLSAPLAGLFIQPLIGQMSDDTLTRYGKRRPYIFVWGILAVLSCFSLLFSQTLWLAALNSWLLSCSINGCTESLRALTGDIISNSQKTNAFSLQTIFAGLGAGCSALIPYFFYRDFHTPITRISLNDIPLSLKLSFLLAGIILLFCLFWVLHSVHEKKPTHSQLLSRIRHRRTSLAKINHFFTMIYSNLKKLPIVIEELIIIQLFTWMGLFAFWLYFSIGLSQHLYGLPASTNSTVSTHFASQLENGISHAGIYLGIYQVISVIYAMLLPRITTYLSPKTVHGLSLIAGAIGMISSGLVINKWLLILSMFGIGIMWGSIMTLPYAIISAEIPHSKMGVYLGIFNISITLPQVIAGLIYEPIYSFVFSKQAINMVILGGVLILIGGIIAVYRSMPLKLQPHHSLKMKCLN